MADSHGLACDMSALPVEERDAHQVLIRRLMGAVVEIVELADGFAFRFARAESAAVVRFVSGERLCCPFLGFTLELAPDHGPLWLRVTGPDGAKAILRVELQLPTPGTRSSSTRAGAYRISHPQACSGRS